MDAESPVHRQGKIPWLQKLVSYLRIWQASVRKSIAAIRPASVNYQFIAYPPHVYDAYAVVLRQLVAQLRYEYVQAAGVEEAVVSPKVEDRKSVV